MSDAQTRADSPTAGRATPGADQSFSALTREGARLVNPPFHFRTSKLNDPMTPRRKHPVHMPIVERSNEPSIVFLTVCTIRRKRILAVPDIVRLLEISWPQATSWMVSRYLIMPDHLHLFCTPGEQEIRGLKQWVRYWKTLASRRWPRPEQHPIWQEEFWDTQIRSASHYEEKWQYVRLNPVRAGLVKESDEWPHQGELNELRW